MKIVIVLLSVAAAHAVAIAKPEVHSISPSSGLMAGGTEITIYGAGLSLVTQCRFGYPPNVAMVMVNKQPRTGDFVTCITPSWAFIEPASVTVSEDEGQTFVPDHDFVFFSYYADPVVTEYTPTAGPSTGATVFRATIANFDPKLPDLSKGMCMFVGDRDGFLTGGGRYYTTGMTVNGCDASTGDGGSPSCEVTCLTPEVCYHVDPVENELCQQQTMEVLFSFNGQDFSKSQGNLPVQYTFQNAWVHPSSPVAGAKNALLA